MTDLIQQRFDEIKHETGDYDILTRFTINGNTYGGEHPYDHDIRTIDFLGWTPKQNLDTVLELASCEGGQSYEIAKSEHTRYILALEGKDWLVKRANMIKDLIAKTDPRMSKVNFQQCNFDYTDDTFPDGEFGSCFCSGVLYHLREPWKLIQKVHQHCEWFYIATHYSKVEDANAMHGGYVGRFVDEKVVKNAWDGIADRVFWFTLPELIRCLTLSGWDVNLLRNWPVWSKNDRSPMVGMLCKRR